MALVLLFSAVLTSCGSSYKAYSIDENYESTRENNPNRTVNGVDGIRVTVPKSISTVICFSPEAAIIMSSAGLASKITGVDKATSSVLAKPEVALSAIPSRNPDVVFITEDYDTSSLEDAEIPYFTVPSYLTINDIKNLIKLIEKMFNVSGDSMSIQIDSSQNVAQQNSQGMINKYDMFIDLGGFKTAGQGTYINEIISVSGGDNIFGDREGYFAVQKQEIIDANPALIFTTDSEMLYTNDSDFAEVDAVKYRRVYKLTTSDETDINYGTQKIAGIIDYINERVMRLKEEKR